MSGTTPANVLRNARPVRTCLAGMSFSLYLHTYVRVFKHVGNAHFLWLCATLLKLHKNNVYNQACLNDTALDSKLSMPWGTAISAWLHMITSLELPLTSGTNWMIGAAIVIDGHRPICHHWSRQIRSRKVDHWSSCVFTIIPAISCCLRCIGSVVNDRLRNQGCMEEKGVLHCQSRHWQLARWRV